MPKRQPQQRPADPADALDAVRETTIKGALDFLERATANALSADGARARKEVDKAILALLNTHDADALGRLWYDAYRAACWHAYTLTMHVLQLRRAALLGEADAKRKARDREAKG